MKFVVGIGYFVEEFSLIDDVVGGGQLEISLQGFNIARVLSYLF